MDLKPEERIISRQYGLISTLVMLVMVYKGTEKDGVDVETEMDVT